MPPLWPPRVAPAVVATHGGRRGRACRPMAMEGEEEGPPRAMVTRHHRREGLGCPMPWLPRAPSGRVRPLHPRRWEGRDAGTRWELGLGNSGRLRERRVP